MFFLFIYSVGGGVKIYQEKVNRYFVYNSRYSRIRLMNPARRKILIKSNMANTEDFGEKEESLNQFCIDDALGNVWFTYLHDERIFIYSYLYRRIIRIIKAYNPKLKELSKKNNF